VARGAKRVTLTLHAEAVELLERLTTPRRKGEFVSRLIRQAADPTQLEHVALLRNIKSQLDRIEEAVAGWDRNPHPPD
jgi:hypothetical protein